MAGDLLDTGIPVPSDLNISFIDYIGRYNQTLLGNLEQYIHNRAVDDTAFNALIAVYSVLILCGAVGNGLVCLVVVRKPHMRTARNVYIINLAVSDLLLCLFTMPFTLMEILFKTWPLGLIMCKLVSALQATSIFVSTLSITAIALDRYQVIVYPTRDAGKRLSVAAILSAIWLLSLTLSLPLFVSRTVMSYHLGLPELNSVNYCYEMWPILHGRAMYSIASMVVQYVVPIVIVSAAYAGISHKLKNRMARKMKAISQRKQSSRRSCNGDDRNAKHRIYRTNLLLRSIALIFGISWLPINILNIVADLYYSLFDEDKEMFLIIFACCHMMGMSSACSNPFLYGWLNENFKREFMEIFAACGCKCQKEPSDQSSRRPSRRKSDEPVALVVLARARSSPYVDNTRIGINGETTVTQASS